MNNVVKNKRIRCILVALLAVFACSCFALSLRSANAFVMPSEIWKTFDMQLSDSDVYGGTVLQTSERGLKLTGTRNSYARLSNLQSGSFKISLLAFSESETVSSEAAIRITNALNAKEYFDIIFTADAATCNVKIGVDGNYYGIYHETENPQSSLTQLGITKSKNAAGSYTVINVLSALELRFEPNEMCVYAGNGKTELLVWNLSEELNDGRLNEKVYDVFERYSVSVVYPSAQKGDKISTVVYEINGVKFDSKILKNDKKRTYVYSDVTGKVGASYVLPVPYISSVYSDDSEKISVEILKDSTVVVPKTDYVDGMTFIPAESGDYTIKYYYGSSSFETVVAVNDSLFQEISVMGEYASYYPVGSTIDLVPCDIYTEAKHSVGKVEAMLTLKKNGQNVEGFVNVSADKIYAYTFEEKGEYTIQYGAKEKYCVTPKIYTVNVGDDGTYFTVNKIAENYGVGDTFEVPECFAVVSGENVATESKIVFPSGKCFANKKITLNETGVYTIIYTAYKDNQAYKNEISFAVCQKVADIVETNGATVSYGQSSLSDSISGIIVNSSNSGTVTFKNAIDLSQNTKEDLLLEMIVDPIIYGDPDFSELEIKITDALNEDNYISIAVKAPEDPRSYAGTGCTVSAGVNGGEYKAVALKINNDGSEGWQEVVGGTKDSGYAYAMSFRGTTYFHSIENQTLRIYYDNEEKALYLGKPWICLWNPYWKNYYAGVDRVKLIDFDDEAHFTDLWEGFTDGSACLSITTKSLVKSNARYVIMNYNGTSFGQEYVADNVAPVIKVSNEQGVPTATVGKEYRLFDAYAYDFSSGACAIKIKVYYRDTDVEMEVTDGKFIPYYAGDYRIVYSAQDGFGNVGEKTIMVTAKKASNVPVLSLTLGEDGNDACNVGEKVKFATATADGGAGKIYYHDVKVYLGSDEIQFVDGTFIPEKAGTYTIKYRVCDYVGNVAEQTRELNVTLLGKPVLNETINVAPVYITERTYALYAPVATLYGSDGNKTSVAPTIAVSYNGGDYQNLSGTMFVPEQAGSAKIKYVYGGNSGENLEKVFDVAVVKINTEPFAIEDYFYTQSATKIATEKGVEIKSEESGAKATFAKELYSGNFSVKLSTDINSSVTKLTVTLIDALTGVKVNVAISGNTTSYQCSAILNGNRESKTLNMFGGKSLELKYLGSDKAFYDGNGNRLFIVDKDADGNVFEGFSEYVYFTLALDGAPIGDGVTINDISGQAMSQNDGDFGQPKIVYNGEFTRRLKSGEKVVLPMAKAYDVLSDVGNVTLTVSRTDITNAVADKDYEIVFDKAGKYPVMYRCTDSAGNTFEDRYTITVVDVTPLDFTLNSEIKESAKVGDTILLPEITVSDGRKVTVCMFAISPNGKVEMITAGEYKFTASGEYVLRFFVYDADYNYSIKEFKIQVK